MKIFNKLILAIFISSLVLTACDDMFDVGSDRLLKTDDFSISASGDTLLSMIGILSQFEKIAERYVILGELRGDLMDLTKNASYDLQEINNFTISSENPYATIKDYYAVINNCNFLLQKLDTSIVKGGVKTMYPEYAATKAIRAWTYLQIALNYGEAIYYEQPILSLEDAEKDYPKYNISILAPILINDLKPWKDVASPRYGKIGELSTAKFFLPIRFLLGDLYLWSAQFDLAANEYWELMNLINTGGYATTYSNRVQWNVVGGEFRGITWWSNTNDILSEIGTTSQFGEGGNLVKLTYPYSYNLKGDYVENVVMIKPSEKSISNWDNQEYYDKDTLYTNLGDLRGIMWACTNKYYGEYTGRSIKGYDNYIYKYYSKSFITKKITYERVITYRIGLLYLRYAEAVNRLGKPNLAFAVLKNGLNRVNLSNQAIVPLSELGEPFTNFNSAIFDENIGMHARGCGYVDIASNYKIPSLTTEDSIKYVEDKIIEELALETAFEGNRFHDLMRVTLRRMALGEGDQSYLANKVAEKYTGNKQAMRDKLMDMDNWYLLKK